jgi:hypothetical protein
LTEAQALSLISKAQASDLDAVFGMHGVIVSTKPGGRITQQKN